MGEIKFRIDPDRMTFGDLISMEDSKAATWKDRRDLLARHMVDVDGNYLDMDAARDVLSDLTIAQLSTTVEAFTKAFQELQNTQIPLASSAT
jgi:hypothetical protein